MHKVISTILICLPFFAGAQNTGINTSSPLFNLDIRSTDADAAPILQIGTPTLDHFVRLFSGRSGDPNPFIQWSGSDPLRFATDNAGFTELMRLTSSGRLGLGTDTPLSEIHVYGGALSELTMDVIAYDDTSGIKLTNGPLLFTHSHYTLMNTSDQFRVIVDTDLGGGTNTEILSMNYLGDLQIDGNLRSDALAGTGTRPLATTSVGEVVVLEDVESFVSVPPCAFKPADNSAAYEADDVFVQGPGGSARLYAPLYLPHGSTIKEFYVRYRDLSAGNLTGRLMRKSLQTSLSTLSSFTTSGTPNVASYISPELFSVVDNESFVYFIEIFPTGSWDSGFLGVYSVRVKVEQ